MSPVVVTVILVAITIALAIAVTLWVAGVASTYTETSVQVTKRLVLYKRPIRGDEYYQELPAVRCCYSGGKYLIKTFYPVGYVRITTMIGPIDNDPTTLYCVYLNVTAYKQLRYIRIRAHISTKNGGNPAWAGNPDVEWKEDNVPAFWYASRYWCPIREDEIPVTITVYVEVPAP